MKKSIPLKEIVGFLPYELKGIATDENQGIETINGISWNDKKSIIELNTDIDAIDIIGFKPLVRPLSDLTKEITHNGETFVPLKYLHQEVFNCEWPEFEIDFQTLDIMVNCPEEFYISFQDIKLMLEKLHEWHFDIYDWIKDGLAVDINTI